MRPALLLFLLLGFAGLLGWRFRPAPAPEPLVLGPRVDLAKLERELAATLADNERLKRAIEAASQNPAAPLPPSAPSPKGSEVVRDRASWAPLTMNIRAGMSDDPEAAGILVEYLTAQNHKRYAGLFPLLKLSEEKLALLDKAMSERSAAMNDLGGYAMDGVNVDSLKKEIEDRFEAEVSGVLGPEDVALLAQVDQKTQTWGAIQALNVQLAYEAEPLSRPQVTRLLEDWSVRIADRPKAGSTGGDLLASLTLGNQQLLEKTVAYLSPRQQSTFAKSLESAVMTQRAVLEFNAKKAERPAISGPP